MKTWIKGGLIIGVIYLLLYLLPGSEIGLRILVFSEIIYFFVMVILEFFTKRTKLKGYKTKKVSLLKGGLIGGGIGVIIDIFVIIIINNFSFFILSVTGFPWSYIFSAYSTNLTVLIASLGTVINCFIIGVFVNWRVSKIKEHKK